MEEINRPSQMMDNKSELIQICQRRGVPLKVYSKFLPSYFYRGYCSEYVRHVTACVLNSPICDHVCHRLSSCIQRRCLT